MLSVCCCSGLLRRVLLSTLYCSIWQTAMPKVRLRQGSKAAKPHCGLDDSARRSNAQFFPALCNFVFFFSPETTQMRVHNFRRRDDHRWQTIGTSSSRMPRRTLGVMRCRRRKEGISGDVAGASIDDNRAAVFQRLGQIRGRVGFPFSFFYSVCSFVQLFLRFVDCFVPCSR